MANREKIDRQREHQANERTFLAWLRTSISLIAFGFAIARFGLFLRQLGVAVTQRLEPFHPIFNSQTLGNILVILGIAVIALAAWRYNQVFWQIERGDYRPNRWIVWLLTGVVMFLGILSMPLLLVWREISSPSTKPNASPPSFQKIETDRNNSN
ncbi:DUF202 domain-containing protein [Pleurocapsales cyanobacterium LEGE 06147]|nr:DUF202 domain-containing protein [Pleurocapsales cyanobacterium LEGE 06147]